MVPQVKKAGSLVIYGQFKLMHLQGETSNVTFDSASKGYYNLYDRKGLQIMLSNFVRIRKQFGAGWFMIHLLFYTFTVPLNFILGLLVPLLLFKNPLRSLSLALKFAGNVARLWGYSFAILSGKAFFIKHFDNLSQFIHHPVDDIFPVIMIEK